MKRLILLITLLALGLMLASCAAQPAGPLTAPATLVPGVDAVLPEAEAPGEMNRQETATLYFRYMDEPYLAPESRVITQSPSKPYEQALLTALLSGPGGHDLTALFPSGVQVISTARQGRTLFVTLSADIMNPYADEGELSAANAVNVSDESLLRRELCMQSIVATVTENCDVDQVQILVEQDTSVTGSLRLDKRYFLRGESGLTDPMIRDDSLILTPGNTISLMLRLCQQQDWQRLYKYIVRVDDDAGLTRPAYRDFVSAMEAQPALMSYAFTGGSIDPYGEVATFTADGTLRLKDGSQAVKDGCILRLNREGGLWRMTLTQLTTWMEVTP